MPAEPTLTAPARGAPSGVRLDGRVRWSWWGQDADGGDRLAARGPHVLSWDSQEASLRAAERAGWVHDEARAGEGGASVVNLVPAQDWLARRVLWLDPAAGLNAWNWALDVALSTGRTWDPGGRVVDACYRKLVAASVPFLFDVEQFRPQWSPRQLRVLRDVLGSAVHTVRSGYGH